MPSRDPQVTISLSGSGFLLGILGSNTCFNYLGHLLHPKLKGNKRQTTRVASQVILNLARTAAGGPDSSALAYLHSPAARYPNGWHGPDALATCLSTDSHLLCRSHGSTHPRSLWVRPNATYAPNPSPFCSRCASIEFSYSIHLASWPLNSTVSQCLTRSVLYNTIE